MVRALEGSKEIRLRSYAQSQPQGPGRPDTLLWCADHKKLALRCWGKAGYFIKIPGKHQFPPFRLEHPPQTQCQPLSCTYGQELLSQWLISCVLRLWKLPLDKDENLW